MFFVSREARNLDMALWKAPEYLEIYRSEMSDDEDEPLKPVLDAEKSKFQADAHKLRSADVYSFAMTCSHILTGNDPHPKMNWRELVHEIINLNGRPQLPDDCPLSLKVLLESCWHASLRPDFDRICDVLEEIWLDIMKGSTMNMLNILSYCAMSWSIPVYHYDLRVLSTLCEKKSCLGR